MPLRPDTAAASLGHAAYLTLRDDLLSGRLPPGRKLKIAELAQTLGTNAAGVREALSRLAAEGLATAEPQKGFRAADLSPIALRDLTKVRIHLEGLCLEQSIAAGDVAWEAGIVAALHSLSRSPPDASDAAHRSEWTEAHRAFHASLVAACPSAWSLQLRDQLWWQSERYRRASLAVAGGSRDVRGEHEALAAAVLDRDVPRSKLLMDHHLQRTADDLRAEPAAAPAAGAARTALGRTREGGG